MKLNYIEFVLMNNPLREYIQKKYELPILQKMTSVTNPISVLEIGCGSGYGTSLIQKIFNPQNIIAIDLDEKMIRKAVKRDLKNVTFKVMDATSLDFNDNQFDAVFDFGIIHHIPNWKECIRELKRVLKIDGELILEDLSIDTFSKGIGLVWRQILDHPYENMYHTKEFVEFITETGFEIRHYRESNPLKLMKYFSLNAVKIYE